MSSLKQRNTKVHGRQKEMERKGTWTDCFIGVERCHGTALRGKGEKMSNLDKEAAMGKRGTGQMIWGQNRPCEGEQKDK